MRKQPISVTLGADNITWLKGRVGAAGARSISDLLDQLVTAARRGGGPAAPRSVVGTITIDDADPGLDKADAAVRSLFEASARRPLVVRELRSRYGGRNKLKARRG